MHHLWSSVRKPNLSSLLRLLPSTHHSHPLSLSTSTLLFTDPTQSNIPLDSTDVVSLNKKIAHHISLGDLDSALSVFNSMKVKTIVSWNSILSGFCQAPGKFKEARQLFGEIPDPDCFSYNIMLGCYKNYFGANVARAYFDKMPVKDVVSWNTILSGYVENGEVGKAWELFSVMPEKNSVSWSAMISGYVKCGDIETAMWLFQAAPVKSVVTWTAMINGCMKAGMVELAEKLFEEMPENNVVTWNAVIAGYVENGRPEDGLKVFKRMLEIGVRPNSSTICGALLCSRDLSGLQLGKQIHQLSSKHPLIGDTTVGTSLISMYCKTGDLEDAWKLFREMPRCDIVIYNAMISGHAQHGAWKVALGLFDEMIGEGLQPDWITFIGVLLACNHAGMVDQGVKYFDFMKEKYGVEKKLDHYTCMVDLLGRAGKLDEAEDLIDKMSLKPNVAIFSTLLGACRIHKNVKLAEFAAKSLLELDPANETAYVQLANVYASMKRWDQVARVRKAMQANKVIKTPGYSWLEIKSKVHQFRSGDKTHPELTSIHAKLNELDEKMKLAGYVPDLEYALYDVGEEQKQQLLLWHSEKLAIAFGLLKLPRGVPIRVFKNLRVCGDCHCAIKYISAIERVEIIVRDTTRFHHFKDGICSCGNYW